MRHISCVREVSDIVERKIFSWLGHVEQMRKECTGRRQRLKRLWAGFARNSKTCAVRGHWSWEMRRHEQCSGGIWGHWSWEMRRHEQCSGGIWGHWSWEMRRRSSWTVQWRDLSKTQVAVWMYEVRLSIPLTRNNVGGGSYVKHDLQWGETSIWMAVIINLELFL